VKLRRVLSRLVDDIQALGGNDILRIEFMIAFCVHVAFSKAFIRLRNRNDDDEVK